MGKINNLSDNSSGIRDLVRDVRGNTYATPLNGASVGRGGMRFYGTGKLLVENEGLEVVGTANISGTLHADGTVTLEGDVNISGPLTVTGNTDITGDLDVTGPMKTTGTLSVEGVTTLKSDLIVTTGGKVKVGSAMTLDPSVSSGALVFSNGAQVFTDATTIQVFKGTSAVQVANGIATLQGNGSTYVRSDSTTGNTIAGPLKNTAHSTISGVSSNVYMDPATGAIKRIV